MIVGPPARGRVRPRADRRVVKDCLDPRPDPQNKVFAMRDFGSISQRRKPGGRVATPGVESLEAIELLSRLGLPARPPAGEVVAFTSNAIPSRVASESVTTQAQSTPVQSANVPQLLTNFGPAQPLPTLPANALPPGCTITTPGAPTSSSPAVPFTPPVALFNPALGQLVAVHVRVSATLTSDVTSQNTSTSSGANITGYTLGAFAINGVGAPITLSGFSVTPTVPRDKYPMNGPPPSFQNDGTTAFFPNVTFTRTAQVDLTNPGDLAAFIAAPGRTTISPTLSATSQSGACSPNGNLQTAVTTQASGNLTITYDYLCPTVQSLVRFGIHHQPTQLRVGFSGPLNPADAANLANYTIITPDASGSFTGRGASVIPITSAVYDPATHSVLLTTARRLNVHRLFQLQVNMPCYTTPTTIEFGSTRSLGGFHNHQGQFVPVVGGKVVRR